MRCGEGIKLFTSSVMWAIWTEEESHETRHETRHEARDETRDEASRPLAYRIFHNTDT